MSSELQYEVQGSIQNLRRYFKHDFEGFNNPNKSFITSLISKTLFYSPRIPIYNKKIIYEPTI